MPDNQLGRDASQRLIFEMFRVQAIDFPELCKAIAEAFSLTSETDTFVAGLDAMFWDFREGERAVEMGWDNWSGFFVVAKVAGSESLIREIAEWLLRSDWTKAEEPV